MRDMIDALELGQIIYDIASDYDGACGCAPFRERMTEALGMPIDWRPFRIVPGRVIGVSTCYIFVLNVLRLAGVAIHNWHIGEPIGTLIEWAKRNGCWQEATEGCAPTRGDVLVTGPFGGSHLSIVDQCDGETINTIDGGQECQRTNNGHDGTGRQMIAKRSRKWRQTHVETDGEKAIVVGWVDIARAPLLSGDA